MSNNNIVPAPLANCPGWVGLVDQTSPLKVAEFISSFPVARSILIEEFRDIWSGATEIASYAPLAVVLNGSGFSVAPADQSNEWYKVMYGTHITHGNFALFWSVRGPGYGARPRPCFLFCDNAAILMEAA